MLKETITYIDYMGEERTEDCYFNLTQSELSKKELLTPGGYAALLQRIIDAKDVPALSANFIEFISDSYGQLSEDGRRFIKRPELTEEFMQTAAYDQLFMKLITDADYATKFINGVMPKVNQPAVAN